MTAVRKPSEPYDSRGRARISVIVPISNSNLEPDMAMMRPAGASIHFQRAGGYDLDKVPDSQQMQQFAVASLDQVLDDLCAVRPDIILYGCTSATLSMGPDYDREFCARIEARAVSRTGDHPPRARVHVTDRHGVPARRLRSLRVGD